MRTIRMKFATDSDKPYSLSLNYASEELLTEAGKELVRTAMEAVVENSPFAVALTGPKSAELIERKVTQII